MDTSQPFAVLMDVCLRSTMLPAHWTATRIRCERETPIPVTRQGCSAFGTDMLTDANGPKLEEAGII